MSYLRIWPPIRKFINYFFSYYKVSEPGMDVREVEEPEYLEEERED